ncbi:MAG: hypothetical protein QOJ23_5070 [Actinomycetota bacterium]|jgi:hypothetical protein|nr:hypothetical protein [Actinomycetota bacterium]
MVRVMRLSALLAIAVLAAVVPIAACASGGKPAPVVVAMAGETVPTTRLVTIAGGICDAARQAPGDIDAARQTFFGQSHDGIHLIARGLQEKDRDASATLLEAKQKVEADFLAPAPGPQVAADLRALAAVTRSSLARFKVSADACPPT